MKKHKRRKVTPVKTLGSIHTERKVFVKSHIRRNSEGKKVVVQGYERKSGGASPKVSTSGKTGSGHEFERIKSRLTSYGNKAMDTMKTFQGDAVDLIEKYTDTLKKQARKGYNTAESKLREARESHKKAQERRAKPNKNWNAFDRTMSAFMSKHGEQYKKYF